MSLVKSMGSMDTLNTCKRYFLKETMCGLLQTTQRKNSFVIKYAEKLKTVCDLEFIIKTIEPGARLLLMPFIRLCNVL